LLLAGFLGEKHAFAAADVETIVREIREELGPESTLATVPMQERHSDGATSLRQASDSVAWLAHFKEIEERLARLERTMGSAIRLLQRLLEPDRVGKPRTPAGR